MSGARRRAAPLALVLAVIMVGWFPALAVGQDKVAFTINDSRIGESSGLATDEPNERYWTVDRSGGPGTAYAIGTDGTVLGSFRIATPVTDLEAVAMRDNVIYLADIGDADKKRDFVTVYVITDPDPGDDQRSYNAYDFSYPDGPQDAEAFFVDADGRMNFITKAAKGEIYRAPADPARDRVNTLDKVGSAPAMITDATLLPGDDQLVVRSKDTVDVLNAKTFKTEAEAAAPGGAGGDAITWTLTGDNLLLGSADQDAKVYEAAVPAPEKSSPSASATASPTSSPTTASQDPGDDEDTGPAPDSSGTYLAVGLAALVAVIAAAVVIVVRR